jgi:purine-nucleoside phosphorylase
MSTVPEAIAARHLGADVLGLAVVTNAAAGTVAGSLAVEDIIKAAASSVEVVAEIVGGVLGSLTSGGPDQAPGTGAGVAPRIAGTSADEDG